MNTRQDRNLRDHLHLGMFLLCSLEPQISHSGHSTYWWGRMTHRVIFNGIILCEYSLEVNMDRQMRWLQACIHDDRKIWKPSSLARRHKEGGETRGGSSPSFSAIAITKGVSISRRSSFFASIMPPGEVLGKSMMGGRLGKYRLDSILLTQEGMYTSLPSAFKAYLSAVNG